MGRALSAVVQESTSLQPATLVPVKQAAVVAKECGIPSLNTGSIAQLRGIIC